MNNDELKEEIEYYNGIRFITKNKVFQENSGRNAVIAVKPEGDERELEIICKVVSELGFAPLNIAEIPAYKPIPLILFDELYNGSIIIAQYEDTQNNIYFFGGDWDIKCLSNLFWICKEQNKKDVKSFRETEVVFYKDAVDLYEKLTDTIIANDKGKDTYKKHGKVF